MIRMKNFPSSDLIVPSLMSDFLVLSAYLISTLEVSKRRIHREKQAERLEGQLLG